MKEQKTGEQNPDLRDEVFRRELAEIRRFEFNSSVAIVFDDMISRSVPHYFEVQQASASMARKLCRKGGRVLDLGSSTGTTLFEIAQALEDTTVELIGIDSSEPMLQRAGEKADKLGLSQRVKFLQGDLCEIPYPEADLVIMNYTLQFVPVADRLRVLQKVVKSLRPGGALLLTEKVSHSGDMLQSIMTDLYYDFKRAHHYSELEISQKREALENFLVPLSLEKNTELMSAAGFGEIELYLKWITFATFVALK